MNLTNYQNLQKKQQILILFIWKFSIGFKKREQHEKGKQT